jgi:hypothetical protein
VRASRSALLIAGLVAALPAFLLSDPGFVPIAERVEGEGTAIRHAFRLKRIESLYLDYELIAESAGPRRPAVEVELNGSVVASLPVAALFRQEFGRALLPVAAARQGANEIVVRVGEGDESKLTLHGRLHNYYGIAPDFPRAAVVSGDAVLAAWSAEGVAAGGVRWLALYAGALLLVWLFQGVLPVGTPSWVLLAPAALLLAILLWALASPRHLWLFPETLLLAAALPGLGVVAALFLNRRRKLVLEIAGVTVVTLLLLEAALRVMNAISPSFIFYADSYGRYRGRPGAPHHGSTLNASGFNDRDHPVERPPQVTTRIVALGDSFAFGVVPRPSNYLTLIEQGLSSEGRVELINLGVSGTNPHDYRAVLVDEGLKYRPDLVLVSLYVGNDLEARRPRWFERSYATTLINFLWHLNRARQTVVVAEGALAAYHDDEPSMDEGSFARIQMDRAWLYTSGDERLTAAVERTVADVRDICDLARDAGADCFVAVIPDETQVDGRLQDEVARAWGRSRESVDFGRPTREIVASLGQSGIPALDLLPAFTEAGATERLYKPRDTHWNVAGNRLAATTIIPALRAWRERRGEDRR